MPKSRGQPKSIETQMESSDSEERQQTDGPPDAQEEDGGRKSESPVIRKYLTGFGSA